MKTFEQIYRLKEFALDNHKMTPEQLEKYNSSMNKVIHDKIFFLNHISDFDLLVDYGCAEGSLIKAVLPFQKNAEYIGYDLSDDMITRAKSNVKESNVTFTTDFNKIKEKIRSFRGTSVITANSLIHEVYSYGSDEEVQEFWSNLFNSGFTYISIRDMAIRAKDYNKKILEDELNEIKEDLELQENGKERIDSYEKIYGKIDTHGELIHLLSKWNYWDNWDREVNERYFDMKTEDLFRKLHRVGNAKYSVTYWEPFTLQYMKNYVKEICDYDINISTHIKVLFKEK